LGGTDPLLSQKNLPTPSIFALSAGSHLVLQPLLFHFLLGNPLDLSPVLGGEGALGMKAQGVLLLAITAWVVSGAAEGGDERERRKEG
jgi:hypothetical protein